MINTKDSKRTNFKIIKCGEGNQENLDFFFFLECVRPYMTIRLKQADIGRD